MNKQNEYVLVITTVPDEKTGDKIAQQLVESRLAACASISSPIRSFYWWKNKITQDKEVMLFIKTRTALYSTLEEKIKQSHPYQVPEIISLPIIQGLQSYLQWIDVETRK
ncbi:MAG: divalent-cation tolerance protein CutA [Candidatus Aminicenantes bacterium]|nr:divalent-cation tolerance protein CutA [Candidatus Aminicenantes bacterium]